MYVSREVSAWVEAAVTEHSRPGEEFWWDVTMAPSGGPENSPFLALVVSARSPLVDQSLNLAGTFVNFIDLDAAAIDIWITEALATIREAQSQALLKNAVPENTPFARLNGGAAPPPANAPGSAPGKLYIPGQP